MSQTDRGFCMRQYVLIYSKGCAIKCPPLAIWEHQCRWLHDALVGPGRSSSPPQGSDTDGGRKQARRPTTHAATPPAPPSQRAPATIGWRQNGCVQGKPMRKPARPSLRGEASRAARAGRNRPWCRGWVVTVTQTIPWRGTTPPSTLVRILALLRLSVQCWAAMPIRDRT